MTKPSKKIENISTIDRTFEKEVVALFNAKIAELAKVLSTCAENPTDIMKLHAQIDDLEIDNKCFLIPNMNQKNF